MAEIFLTLIEVEALFQSIIVSILGWGTCSPSKENNVRISWIKEGMPGPSIDDNYVYLQVTEIDGQYNRQRDTITQVSEDVFIKRSAYTRVVGVSCILYGSQSFDNAQTLRDGMFSDEIRETLAQNEIYIVPDISAPRRVPEVWEGQWWERSDIQFVFNELIVKETVANYIESSEVIINDRDGVQADFTVTDPN